MNKQKIGAVALAATTVLAAIGELDRNDVVYPVTDKAIEIIKFLFAAFGIVF